jgi:phosphohistidine phosphatase SixA
MSQSEISAELFFVRHGEDFPRFGLTEVGQQQALDAAVELDSLGFNDKSLLLSSTATRAKETGAIIADLLGSQVVEHRWLEVCGLDPDLVYIAGDPRRLVKRIAEVKGLAVTPQIAVVTHQPLIDVFNLGGSTRNGQVVKYADSRWPRAR